MAVGRPDGSLPTRTTARSVAPVVHGGAPDGWLDFSANPNPLGAPAVVSRVVGAVRYDRYADLDPVHAVHHLAEDAGVDPSALLLTSGATEGLRLIATQFLGPDVPAVVIGPTYGEYARVARLAGAPIIERRAAAPRFDPLIGVAGEVLADDRPAVVVIGDPNNPTARPIGADGHAHLLAALARRGPALLVIDQSFRPFSRSPSPDAALLATGRVILVRSLTKRLGMPGVRLGYVLSARGIVDRLREAQDPWAVGAHAIAAAGSARWELEPGERETLAAWRADLVAGLQARGFLTVPSDANYVLVSIGAEAASLVAHLAGRRIAVRDAASFGLSGLIRLAVRSPRDQSLLFRAIDEHVATGGQTDDGAGRR
ncbi:MAG: aminotransferase class I/II-fold pyridoxal phosphate-dependent enzyme [Chloroflexota bacterium]